MKYKLFLDTNIYDGANYAFRNAFFTSIKNRAIAGELELHINSVIENETKQHINRNIKKVAKELLNTVKNPLFAGFKHIPDFGDKLQVPDPKQWSKKTIEEFDEWLEACNAKRISTNGINVERIISDYFSEPQKAPFEPQKKEEFKDAIAVESIICELDNLKVNELYCLVSNDKGFCQAFEDKTRGINNVLCFPDLKAYIDFITEMDAKDFKKYLDEGELDDDISDEIRKVVESANYSIEKLSSFWIDEMDVVNVDDLEYETSVIEMGDKVANISLNVKCKVSIWYKYTDEDQSFWDKEEQAYLWQKIVEMQEIYDLEFEMVLALDVSEWIPEIEEKQDVWIIESIDVPEQFDLDEDNLIESEDLSEPYFEDDEPKGYTFCPDCGCAINENNDGGNGFCSRCAPKY